MKILIPHIGGSSSKMFAFALVLAAGWLAKPLAQTQQWVQVAPLGGKFSVMMPTKPDEEHETGDIKLGNRGSDTSVC